MEYFDEELLEAKRELERQKHTTLGAGMCAGEELITFIKKTFRNQMYLPKQFVFMPESVKKVKFPYKNAPKMIITSLDSTVNFAFNFLPVQAEDGEIKNMANQSQTALKNMNPSIRTKNQVDTKTGIEQLDYVFGYLYGIHVKTLGDLYMKVLAPEYIGAAGETHIMVKGDGRYEKNSGLDANKDNIITKNEAEEAVKKKRDDNY